jgi:U3 small nucleolar RNA-associated protein 24
MGVQKKTRKFATVKRVISQRDDRLKKNQPTPLDKQKKQSGKDELVRTMYVFDGSHYPLERTLC